MVRPRLQGTEARRKRRRIWHQQKKLCYWCGKEVVLPEQLLADFVPLDSLYEQGMADMLPRLHQQLMRVPEFRERWLTELATLDHLVEFARGGSDEDSNLVVACAPCNEDRGGQFRELLETGEGLWLESADAANAIPLIVAPGSGWPPN